jgi:CheY-like chemotaxis protein
MDACGSIDRPLTVLVVDDRSGTVESAAAVLGDEFRVLIAGSAEEALRIAAAEAPDILLTDIAMPGMDSCELARRFRAAVGLRPLLIAVIGHASAGEREYMAAGFDLHLTKPVEPCVLADLLHRLAHALWPRRGERGVVPMACRQDA